MNDEKTPKRGGYEARVPANYIGKLDGYFLLKKLGGGGMGDVYLAQGESNPEMRRALKIVKTDTKEHLDEIIERWQVECQVSERVRALKHPHIVQVYDGKALLAHDKTSEKNVSIFYLAMEYVEGRTLAQVIRGTPPTIDQGLKIGIDIAGALEAAHGIGVLHRDMKPGNIMVDDTIEDKVHAYLLDFGIAKLLSEPGDMTKLHGDVAVGTLNYMPPEELMRIIDADYQDEQDERGDIWALGKVLYELFGRIARPYQEATEASGKFSLERAAHEALAWRPKPIAEIPPGVNEVIIEMTAYRRDSRPDARDVRARLGRELYARDALSGTQPITIGPQEVRLEQLANDLKNEHMTEGEFVRKQGLFVMVPSEGYFRATHPNLRMEPRYARDTTYFKVFAPQSKKEWVFGRGEDVDCRYSDRTMSRKHFKIERPGIQMDGKEVFKIIDLGSNNGTKLNGITLRRNVPEIIRTGDRVIAGNLDLTFAASTELRKSADTIQFRVNRDVDTPKKRDYDIQSGA